MAEEVDREAAESVAFFRAALEEVEVNQSIELRALDANYGDDRKPKTIHRSIQCMANGGVSVSGEMRVWPPLMLRDKRRSLAARAGED